MTPFFCAIHTGKVDNGANIEYKNSEGITPLHIASCLGFVDIVQYLISQGAKIESKDSKGLTPLICSKFKPEISN